MADRDNTQHNPLAKLLKQNIGFRRAVSTVRISKSQMKRDLIVSFYGNLKTIQKNRYVGNNRTGG